MVPAAVVQVLPADKPAAVMRFQDGGRTVAFVGDGVNGAPALATANAQLLRRVGMRPPEQQDPMPAIAA